MNTSISPQSRKVHEGHLSLCVPWHEHKETLCVLRASVVRNTNGDRCSERGQSLALVAAFLVFVGLPLLSLVIDGTRLYRVRSLLQVATDAACEDAAVTAPDFAHYKATGETRLGNLYAAKTNAAHTFQQTLTPNGMALDIASFSVTVWPDHARNHMACTSYADVPLILSPLTITINTTSTSAIRFSSH